MIHVSFLSFRSRDATRQAIVAYKELVSHLGLIVGSY